MMLILKDYLIKLLYLVIVCIILIISACNNKQSLEKEDYIGKIITFPDTMYIITDDSLSNQYKEKLYSDNKKVIHIFKADCGKCVDGFNKLNKFLKNLHGDFEIFYFVNTSDFDFFREQIYFQLDSVEYLLYNRNNEFERTNTLEGSFKIFNTFIVDKNNIIEFIGNPVESKDNMSEYINHLVLNNE